jgi:predicted NAD/FAD-binding protein
MTHPRIAVVGSGIAGIQAAHLLQARAEVTLLEQDNYVGGHTNTEYIERHGKVWPVNTGFIVYNDWTYPNFIAFMNELGVESEASSMSFSVKCDTTGVEYNGTSLDTLFAQRRNLLSPGFLRMIADILRFNRELTAASRSGALTADMTLGDYLRKGHYSRRFRNHYIIPMGAAIWSCGEAQMDTFPLAFFARFFDNHGMLSVDERPQWRVVKGGSQSYVQAFLARFKGNVRLQSRVDRIERDNEGVTLFVNGHPERFDHVVIASHSDQALAMLAAPSQAEREVLGAIGYLENDVVLHTDTRVLPRTPKAWAAWNYRLNGRVNERPSVTYNMNILQNFDCRETFCVTLNDADSIDPARVIKRFRYSHPVYTRGAMEAQQRHTDISGMHRTWYCGAYWFNGFHEDGVLSGKRAAEQLLHHLSPGATHG